MAGSVMLATAHRHRATLRIRISTGCRARDTTRSDSTQSLRVRVGLDPMWRTSRWQMNSGVPSAVQARVPVR
jgi:hypothetical protein